jgi:hypothetical protein
MEQKLETKKDFIRLQVADMLILWTETGLSHHLFPGIYL